MNMNHDLSPVFAQGGLFHASYVELHFDALHGTRTFLCRGPLCTQSHN